MILVFIFLSILLFLLFFTILILLSTLRINISNLHIGNTVKERKENFLIIFSIYLFNKVKILSIKIDKDKVKKVSGIIQGKKEKLKKFEKNIKFSDIFLIKKLNLVIVQLNLDFKLGLESPVITAYTVAFIASLISIILPHFTDRKISNDKYRYKIQPLYKNKNLYNLKLNCIIKVKIVHIINVIYMLKKQKERRGLNERTTSNRGAYGYSYEQH